MDIDEILKDIELNLEKTADSSDENASETPNEEIDTSPESVEKLASFLDAYSQRDTLVDDIARLAVLQDKVTLARLAKEAKKND